MSIYNPDSGRLVRTNLPTFCKLLQTYTLVDNVLVPKNTHDFVFAPAYNHWLRKTSQLYKRNAQHYDIHNNTLVPIDNNTVMGVCGRRIMRGGYTYNALIAAGYTYNAEKKMLTHVETIDIIDTSDASNASDTQNNNMPEMLLHLLNSDLYTNVTFTCNRNHSITTDYRQIASIQSDWNRITAGAPVTNIQLHQHTDIHAQPLLSNARNCIIACIQKYYTKHKTPLYDIVKAYKMYTLMYPYSVSIIAARFKICIVLHCHGDTYTYGAMYKPQMHVQYNNSATSARMVPRAK